MEEKINSTTLSIAERHRRKELNEFIIFQIKHANKIGPEDSFSFYHNFERTNIGVPEYIGILCSSLLFSENVFLALIFIVLFSVSIYISFQDRKRILKNVYNHKIAYNRVLNYIDMLESSDFFNIASSGKNTRYKHLDTSRYYDNIRNLYKNHYQCTWLYRNIADESAYPQSQLKLMDISMIDKGYCMCCGEFGAKRLSKKTDDFLLCDLCYDKETNDE